MLKLAVNFQSLSKVANANVNRAYWIGGDTEIRRSILQHSITHKFNDPDTNKSKNSGPTHQALY